jgi:hypothetical protein
MEELLNRYTALQVEITEEVIRQMNNLDEKGVMDLFAQIPMEIKFKLSIALGIQLNIPLEKIEQFTTEDINEYLSAIYDKEPPEGLPEGFRRGRPQKKIT